MRGLFLIALVLQLHSGGAGGSRSGSFDCTKFDSNSGARFDLRELQRTSGQPSYVVEDGDVPCTKYVSVLRELVCLRKCLSKP